MKQSLWLVGAVLIVMLGSCSGGSNPTASRYPSCDELASANDRVANKAWSIIGFDQDELVEPVADDDNVARLHVGDTKKLILGAVGGIGECIDRIVSVTWVSTNTAVASVQATSTTTANLVALRVGRTSVFASIRFDNGNRFRAYPVMLTGTLAAGGLTPTIEVIDQ